jgi:phage head maturation protease
LQESQNSRSTNRSHEEVVENERRPVYRSTQPEELIFRSAEGEAGVVEGRVVPYEEWTEVDSMLEGHFMESFAHGSMSKTIMERGKGVQVYMDHGRSPQYGRQPVAQLEDTWEDSTGVFFRAALLKGLPEFFMDGLRKGLYGASLGADAIRTLYRRWPVKSDYNPDGIEERVRQEVRAFDYSLTSRPIYASATLTFRSIEDEFFVEQVRSLAEKHPEGLLQMFRSAIEVESEPPAEPEKPEQPQEEEAEPPHSEPPAPEDPDAGKASRDTQPPLIDYLAEDEEEEDEWRL